MTIIEFQKFIYKNINLIGCTKIVFDETETTLEAMLFYSDYTMSFKVMNVHEGKDFEISYFSDEGSPFYFIEFEEQNDISWNELDKNKFEHVFDNALEVIEGEDSGWDIEKVTGLTRATVSKFRKGNNSLRASNVGSLIALSNYLCLKIIEIEIK